MNIPVSGKRCCIPCLNLILKKIHITYRSYGVHCLQLSYNSFILYIYKFSTLSSNDGLLENSRFTPLPFAYFMLHSMTQVNCFFNLNTYFTQNMLHLSMFSCFFCLSAFFEQKQNMKRSFTLRDMTHSKNGIKGRLCVLE
jgi:hypothetical protein